jgi:hypothetical protein
MHEGAAVYLASLTLGPDVKREVTVTRAEGGWIAECGSLPGCIGKGKTAQEAVAGLRVALEGGDSVR